VGSEVGFQMNYSALMRAMAAPDIKEELLDYPPIRPSQHKQDKARHLALVLMTSLGPADLQNKGN